MTKLTKLNTKAKTIDSREVAEMLEKTHAKLLRDIEGSKDRKGIIQVLGEAQMGLSNYFIKSSYINSQNKEQPCYLVTKMGCEILANKMTGEKGILFTAKYVERFNEMEQNQNNGLKNYLDMSEEDRAIAYFTERKNNKLLTQQLEEQKPKVENYDNFLNSEKTYTFTQVAKAISTRFEEENVDVKLSAMKLTKFLRENGVLNKSRTPNKTDIYGKVINGRYNNLPNKAYEDYFNVIMMEGEHGTTQTRVKAKGVEFIYNLLKTNLK